MRCTQLVELRYEKNRGSFNSNTFLSLAAFKTSWKYMCYNSSKIILKKFSEFRLPIDTVSGIMMTGGSLPYFTVTVVMNS
jgi:hypothetical protein